MVMRRLAAALRSTILWRTNTHRAKLALAGTAQDRPRSYIVVTPHLIHLAPLATLNHGGRVQPVFVANGINHDDSEWLRMMCPEVPIVPLRASLGNNPDSMLSHGIVIDYLAQAELGAFYIQDADCFVSDRSFWSFTAMDLTAEYAVCAFVRKGSEDRPEFPETFLTALNAPLLRKYRKLYGVVSESVPTADSRAMRILDDAGYPAGRVLETYKDYFDTLQQYWVIATHQGMRHRRAAGEGETVHHIGGTSYLYKSFEKLAHWDYWPLAVHYFNLRILEMPAVERFRKRFKGLIDYHGSADALIEAYPHFAGGWRKRSADRIISELGVERVFGFAIPGIEGRICGH